MTKAKKVLTMYGKHANVVEYEYRGRTYYVEYANNWTYCTTPAHIQHRDNQERIDREIEAEANRKPGGKEVDLDEIWEMLDWD
jgi:hypothetical protein